MPKLAKEKLQFNYAGEKLLNISIVLDEGVCNARIEEISKMIIDTISDYLEFISSDGQEIH